MTKCFKAERSTLIHNGLVMHGSSGPPGVRALAGVTVLCSWTRHFTITVPLSTQEHKWVPSLGADELSLGQPDKLGRSQVPAR